jgi:hypothetical protein
VEIGVHDMMGAAGTVQGWEALCHTALLWGMPVLAVAVAATGLLETLAPVGGLRLRRPRQAAQTVAVTEPSAAIPRHAFAEPAAPAPIVPHGAD